MQRLRVTAVVAVAEALACHVGLVARLDPGCACGRLLAFEQVEHLVDDGLGVHARVEEASEPAHGQEELQRQGAHAKAPREVERAGGMQA